MKHYKVKNMTGQAGMTLIELSVVLLILVGLAGLLVPYVSGFADKTHDSTTVNSITELDNTMGRFRTQRNVYPDNLETLATGITSTTVYPDLITPALVKPVVINQTIVDSLKKVGITNVLPNVASGSTLGNATFKSTEGITSTALAATSTLAFIAPGFGGNAPVAAHLAYAFGGDASQYLSAAQGGTAALPTAAAPATAATQGLCYDYVALGIGDRSELTGAALQSAPVLFTSNGDTSPEKKYSRFLAVFKVQSTVSTFADANGCPDQAQPATFVGTVANLDFPALVGAGASKSWSTGRLTTN